MTPDGAAFLVELVRRAADAGVISPREQRHARALLLGDDRPRVIFRMPGPGRVVLGRSGAPERHLACTLPALGAVHLALSYPGERVRLVDFVGPGVAHAPQVLRKSIRAPVARWLEARGFLDLAGMARRITFHEVEGVMVFVPRADDPELDTGL